MADIFSQLQIATSNNEVRNQTVLSGGPVQTDRGFIIHTPVGKWDSSLKVTDNIAVTTSQDIMQAIANNNGPEKSLLALGYAGWGPGQLE